MSQPCLQNPQKQPKPYPGYKETKPGNKEPGQKETKPGNKEPGQKETKPAKGPAPEPAEFRQFTSEEQMLLRVLAKTSFL